MRRRVIAGNWKMYKTLAETRAHFSRPSRRWSQAPSIATSSSLLLFTAVSTAAEAAKGTHRHLGPERLLEQGRCIHRRSLRPYARRGRLPLRSSSAHSERRQLFRETDDNVAKKTLVAPIPA